MTRVALAVEEAAAAIAVDGTWPKGYFFKAIALEELGDYAKALAACEEGLHIHRCVGPAAGTYEAQAHMPLACAGLMSRQQGSSLVLLKADKSLASCIGLSHGWNQWRNLT